MFVYGTRSAPSSLARRPTPPTTIRTITRQVAKLGSLRRRSERETARANYRSSQIIIGRPTDSPLDADSHEKKIVRKNAAYTALNQLCRRLSHAVRAQMCQIST